MRVVMGTRTLNFPEGDLAELREANPLLGDMDALRARLKEDGYLLLRGLIDRDAVLHARRVITDYMAEQDALTPGTPALEGVMPNGGKSVGMMGKDGIAHHEAVLRVLEAPELFDLFEGLFGEEVMTFGYKWLRGVGHEGFTGAHYDSVYMGRGSTRLHTCWVPFGDIPIKQGTLAMCLGSHNRDGFAKLRDTYGQMDVDRDLVKHGWFTQDPLEITERFGGQWATTEYRAGDVMVFGMHMMHGSTTNTTDRFRISADVRFQPAADPADPRWAGQNATGHTGFANPTKASKTIEEARVAWGV